MDIAPAQNSGLALRFIEIVRIGCSMNRTLSTEGKAVKIGLPDYILAASTEIFYSYGLSNQSTLSGSSKGALNCGLGIDGAKLKGNGM
jgi:hypothetical protein